MELNCIDSDHLTVFALGKCRINFAHFSKHKPAPSNPQDITVICVASKIPDKVLHRLV